MTYAFIIDELLSVANSALEDARRQIQAGRAMPEVVQKSLLERLEKIYNDIKKIESQVKAEDLARISAMYEGRNILLEEAIRATYLNVEYNHEIFRTALTKACGQPGIVTIIGDGAIIINMNEFAGTLQEYAAAIDSTRRALRVGPYNPDYKDKSKFRQEPAAISSMFWKKKYYGKGRGFNIDFSSEPKKPNLRPNVLSKKAKAKVRDVKFVQKYEKTIRMRLSKSKKPAPFWQLLDAGLLPLASDYGGTAYPEKGIATHFVASAETKIYSKYLELKKEYSNMILDLRLTLNNLAFIIEQIKKLDILNRELIRAEVTTRLIKTRGAKAEQLLETEVNQFIDRIYELEASGYSGKDGARIQFYFSTLGKLRIRIEEFFTIIRTFNV